jgi:hypothetical protein
MFVIDLWVRDIYGNVEFWWRLNTKLIYNFKYGGGNGNTIKKSDPPR